MPIRLRSLCICGTQAPHSKDRKLFFPRTKILPQNLIESDRERIVMVLFEANWSRFLKQNSVPEQAKCRLQGCQIDLGLWYQNRKKCTRWTQNVPNGHKNPKCQYIFPMVINYIHIFQSKALSKIYPKWDFCFENKPSGNLGRLVTETFFYILLQRAILGQALLVQEYIYLRTELWNFSWIELRALFTNTSI
jgi:hypothetical protein